MEDAEEHLKIQKVPFSTSENATYFSQLPAANRESFNLLLPEQVSKARFHYSILDPKRGKQPSEA